MKSLVHAHTSFPPQGPSDSKRDGGLGEGNSEGSIILAVVFVLGLFIAVSPSILGATPVNDPVDQILTKAFSAYIDGNDKSALSYFEEVVRLDPKNKPAQRGLDKVKVRLKQKEDDDRTRALTLAKMKIKEGDKMDETGDTVAAIDAYHAAADAVPGYKPASSRLESIRKKTEKEVKRAKLNISKFAFSRGTLAYLDRDWAKAYKIWSERSEVDPNNIPLKNATLRAESKFRKLMLAERMDFFRRGARAFYEQGLYARAKESWDKVIELDAEDQEAVAGRVRAENQMLAAAGKGRDNRVHDLLEQALEYYSQQNWRKSLDLFTQITQLDPEFSTAKEYAAKLNDKLASVQYVPGKAGGEVAQSWRREQSSNQGTQQVEIPEKLENVGARRLELESQLKRDPTNIRVQQELDKIVKLQDDEGERIYKDGLIAYSQGSRSQAIQKWKQVLVINPDHKKALAALKKARAEEERSEAPEAQ